MQRLIIKNIRNISNRATLKDNKSFVSAFIDSVKRQMKEDKDLQRNVDLLDSKKNEFQDSEYLKRAKEMFGSVKTGVSDNQASKLVADALEQVKKHADSVGKTVDEVLKEINENEFVKGKVTEPIRNHPAYKNTKKGVGSMIDESSARYGGYSDKEKRQTIKDRKKETQSHIKPIKENENAGSSVVKTEPKSWIDKDSDLYKSADKLKNKFDKSDNLLVETFRDITHSFSSIISSIFSETTEGKAIKYYKIHFDESFEKEAFLADAQQIIIPDILDAYFSSDIKTLEQWCQPTVLSLCIAIFKGYEMQKVTRHTKMLDLRRVEFREVEILEDGLPSFELVYSGQEITYYKDKKGKIVAGNENSVLESVGIIKIAKHIEFIDNEITNGWRVHSFMHKP